MAEHFHGTYHPHPLADLFPLMLRPGPLDELTEDIRQHGIREPIVMLDGMVLDGRNRYLAARECGADVPFVQYDGDDPLGFVVSLNLKRRHLSDSQRQMVGAKIANLPRGSNQHPPIGGTSAPTAALAAEMLNTSERGIERARVVVDQGTPALVAAVEAGEVSVSAAAEVARLPEPEQVEIVEEGPAAVREVAAVQRADLPEAEKAARRKAIVDGAVRGGRGGTPSPRKNPDYQPNPARDAFLAVADTCESLAAKVAECGAPMILGQVLNETDRRRLTDALEGASAAITALTEEAANAAQARA